MNRLSEQEAVWAPLSDLFVDTEISYKFIARQVAHLDIQALERILYFDVAPVCIGNMLTPIPPIWTGFNEDWLISNIRNHLHKFNTSRFYRFKIKCKVRFYKCFLNSEWLKVVAEIRIAQAEHISANH